MDLTRAYGDDVPLVDVIAAEANRPFGHIALGETNGPPLMIFCDLGEVLHFWSWNGAELDATGARNLAEELLQWAEKKERHAEQAAS